MHLGFARPPRLPGSNGRGPTSATMTAGFRIGIDLGGTKIEAAALDRAGAVRARRRIATPAGDYDGDDRGDRRAGRGDRARASAAARPVGIGIPGTIVAADRAGQERQLDLADRPAARPRPRGRARPRRCASPTTPIALPCRRRATAPRRAAAACSASSSAPGSAAASSSTAGSLVGANAIAGEWGHNPLPWPRADELPGPRLLLRPLRLHRDVSVRTRPRRRPSPPRRRRR